AGFYAAPLDSVFEDAGYGLRHEHGESPTAVVAAAYAGFHFKPWRFGKVAQAFWSSACNVRAASDDTLVRLQRYGDATALPCEAFKPAGLASFGNAPAEFLAAAYPAAAWRAWLLQKLPAAFWAAPGHVAAALEGLLVPRRFADLYAAPLESV